MGDGVVLERGRRVVLWRRCGARCGSRLVLSSHWFETYLQMAQRPIDMCEVQERCGVDAE